MSLKQRIQSLLPDKDKLEKDRFLKLLGSLIHDPNLWHINRNSIAGAVAIGFACAWVLPPFQMVCAALFAIYFRKNLPLATVATWITNPITMPPMLYAAYWLGGIILGVETIGVTEFVSTLKEFLGYTVADALTRIFHDFGMPLLVGSLVFAFLSSILGYWGMQLLWRMHVIKKLKERRFRQLEKQKNNND